MLHDSGVPASRQVQDDTAYGEPLNAYRADFDQDGDVDFGRETLDDVGVRDAMSQTVPDDGRQ